MVNGEVGSDGENIAVGRGQQQVHIDLGDRSTADIAEIIRLVPRLSSVIFGDGYGSSVVEDLREIKREIRSLTSKQQALENKVNDVKQQLNERTETSNQMRIALFISTIGVIILVILQFFGGS